MVGKTTHHNQMKDFYRRHLPHWQPMGGMFFVTFRLKGSMPLSIIKQLQEEFEFQKKQLLRTPTAENKATLIKLRKSQFARYDAVLDGEQFGDCFLREQKQAQLVIDEIQRWNGKLYDLLAYCIMPNHVHLLIDTSLQLPEDMEFSNLERIEYEPLQNIMKQVKGASARFVNQSLCKLGQFWQHESYDHLVRNDKELNNVVAYILNNPVKARLVRENNLWPFSYCKWP